MKRAIAVIMIAAATGCTVGPDYERPEASSLVPDAWSQGDAIGASAGEPTRVSAGVSAGASADDSAVASTGVSEGDLVQWWSGLGDDALTDLIERAFVANRDLAEARERVIEARARRGIANADRWPTLDASAGYSRIATGDDAVVIGGAPPGIEADVYELGAVAGWELDLWGRVARLVEAADADIEFAVEDVRAVRVALAAEVAREVVRIRAVDREIELVETTVETDRDAVEIAQARSVSGFGDELDVARAQRDLESNRALLPGLRADRRASEFRLAVLLGVPPGEIDVLRADMPRRDVVPSRGVPADLLLRRPDLRRAERSLAASTARIGAADAERLPRVTLSGSISLQGPDLGDAVDPDTFLLQAGPGISLPIFQGGRIRSGILQAESQQRQALIRLEDAVLDALAEVETSSMRRARSEQRVAGLTAAEAEARTAETLSVNRYAAGRVDFLDVTEARRARLAIERSRVAAEREALLRLIDLYTALGGGWSA